MNVVLDLDSYKLVRTQVESISAPPVAMRAPAYQWVFTLTDGLELAIQTNSRYHNVTKMATLGSTPVSCGTCVMDYSNNQLKVTIEVKHNGWSYAVVYSKVVKQ